MPRVLVPTRATSLLPLAIIVFLTFSISAGLSVAALSSRYWVKEVNPIFSSVATTGLFESCISFQDGSISSCHPFPDERVCSRAKHDEYVGEGGRNGTKEAKQSEVESSPARSRVRSTDDRAVRAKQGLRGLSAIMLTEASAGGE
ncbi:hypothetical protein M427DRAFT_366289 [Gonapodya prolifera JEL478]|uniref:Transmembrane protein n=1 Tax=Gonapodya prolifera (strain JEL478) TaxID=1344416 RepID=A0A139A9Y8_GONPJ|nr:hypothetical protein M427DRAFT_366289 [Gonapodya prolifera JEL478]|eukprot:KXS13662.1 hypothetical protein M427DRAFT_366289 [Gonapodya prolifera JEL478]